MESPFSRILHPMYRMEASITRHSTRQDTKEPGAFDVAPPIYPTTPQTINARPKLPNFLYDK